MRRECRERFPRHRLKRKPLVSDPGMHRCTCVTQCRNGCRDHSPAVAEKTNSGRMRNPQFYVSGKRPLGHFSEGSQCRQQTGFTLINKTAETRYVDGTPTSEVTPVTIRYIHPTHHGYPKVTIMVMNDRLTSLSFHVNRRLRPYSSNQAISNIDF